MTEPMAPSEFLGAEGLQDWRIVGDGACAFYRTGSFEAGARLVTAIGELRGLGARRPDIDVRFDGVTVRLITMTADFTALTGDDVELARAISVLAYDQGLTSDPSNLQDVQVTIDALVCKDVMPFWRAVLGYEYRPDSRDEDLIDLRRRGPSIWFQDMDAPRPQRNRMHIDVWVPPELAEGRIKAAIEAGGRLVSDAEAPSGWVLADPEGNEVCVATIEGRG